MLQSAKMSNILNTSINSVRNVQRYIFGEGSLASLELLIKNHRNVVDGAVVYFIDIYFKNNNKMLSLLPVTEGDDIVFISTIDEPTTEYIDSLVSRLNENSKYKPCAIVGIGGGTTLDITKAVSNLIENGGLAEHYQGWDLVKKPGIFKIGIPTLSGTGAEATRTCVMTNKKTGLKLGMNSDYTVFDQIIMDPDLTNTVPKEQYFYTGMDAYIHCMESLNGSYRNAIGDAYSVLTINLCREIFHSSDMVSDENRSKMMVASYLGGCAIATSYVGVVHPFSAGLSVVLGMHHCIANCTTMRAMEDFYPQGYKEFWNMVDKQGINVPLDVCQGLTDNQYDQLFNSTVIHEKPLINALGEDFKNILTKEKVLELFKSI
jgi:3-deoxy-alpha-D-manno-octulosonate 8-oxidase